MNQNVLLPCLSLQEVLSHLRIIFLTLIWAVPWEAYGKDSQQLSRVMVALLGIYLTAIAPQGNGEQSLGGNGNWDQSSEEDVGKA